MYNLLKTTPIADLTVHLPIWPSPHLAISPHLPHSPPSRFPTPDSRLPTPCSLKLS
ncbi:hypothetical protein BJP36_35485 [Moorena producens JHB]|uniref:Uncharacterized protein n=1 Tax=Moorena producens (strain JHB) TaxID=1454205 RepID=A0A9Q9UW09_MOOP1|nr:hypothetical protein [Moorena producens]WAN69395.1 hypothetical protein BJP36_35485 [Moorena producens JHB]